ncbi:unnamed protein product [Leuciscus chuanchicus]
MCAPGNRVYWPCADDVSTTCGPCPESTYADEPNDLSECLKCTECDLKRGLRVSKACTRSSDTVCEPLERFFCTDLYKHTCRLAVQHSECRPGQYIIQAGTGSTDTVCADCTADTYSDGSLSSCKPHTNGSGLRPFNETVTGTLAELLTVSIPVCNMEGLKPPQTLCLDSNDLSRSWKTWKDEFMLYVELTVSDDDEKKKVTLFSYLVGESGRELMDTLMSDAARDTWRLKDIIDKFDGHCNPCVNETVERYRFFTKNQRSGESIDSYVTELRVLAKTCNFGQLRDSLIRDRVVCGLNSTSMRERLLREKNMSLDTCIQLCRAAELSRENCKAISGPMVEEVHALRGAVHQRRTSDTVDCKFCGKTHDKNKLKCPAYGKKCKKCGKDNHFAAKCRARPEHREKTIVHKVTECESEEYEEILCVTEAQAEDVNAVGTSRADDTQLFAGMLLGTDMVKFQIDCGATCNIIPIHLINPDTKLEHTDSVLLMYNKSKLRPLGKCKVKLRNPRNQKLYQLEFQVVDGDDAVPLLGKKTSEAMKLIKVHYENIMAIDSIVTTEKLTTGKWCMEQIKDEYADVFTGDGCPEGEYKIEVDKTVRPVQLPKRRVPVSMMKPLKAELQHLQRRGIITPVECSTDWISGMVVVQKQNGNPRVCIDPRPLNKALKRSHFPLPTIEDILPDLSKAKVFTVCDVKSGFWHVKLHEESSYLTTFATPFGRYRWLRMPMGISPAPEVFQRKLTQALDDLPGLYIIADDVLITGQGESQEAAEQDHDRKLRLFLHRCRQQNIKLNAEKFKLRQNEASYIGHRLTADGLKVDPEKVRAITQMPRPADVKSVQRLLGMVCYLAKFCPHLSDQCEPLRKLTHKDSEWNWTEQHEEAFHKLKDTIAQAPVLKFYSPDEELTVQCDASDTGLGAALMQRGKPIAFASRALTQTERGYAQIEKEFLALVFSIEKFHQYTYGRKVTVQSDHKPLEVIVKKPLLSAPKRLQRMMLRIQKYDLEVVYVPDRLNAIRSATTEDKTLQILINTMRKGWPNDKNKTPWEIRQYFSFQEELTYQDGVVFRGYPQSNGKAESAVKTAKMLMRKAKAAGRDPYLARLDHRNTPSQGLMSSPAQRLLNRRTRTLLPTKTSLLQPQVISAQEDLINNQQRQCAYYDRSAKDLDELEPGDRVRVQPFAPYNVWRLGNIQRPIDARSYEVLLDTGNVLRRNRRHLRRAPGATPSRPPDIDTDDTGHSETASPLCTSENVTPLDNTNSDVPVTTRSGRIVKKPSRYMDFVAH